jgi:hypothetical protein
MITEFFAIVSVDGLRHRNLAAIALPCRQPQRISIASRKRIRSSISPCISCKIHMLLVVERACLACFGPSCIDCRGPTLHACPHIHAHRNPHDRQQTQFIQTAVSFKRLVDVAVPSDY